MTIARRFLGFGNPEHIIGKGIRLVKIWHWDKIDILPPFRIFAQILADE